MEGEIFSGKKDSELIKTSQFIEFINSFNKPLVCCVCGKQSWTVTGPLDISVVDGQPKQHVMESLTYSNYNPKTDSAISFPGGMPLFRISCNTCSHILLFSYKHARTLMLAKLAEEGGPQDA